MTDKRDYYEILGVPQDTDPSTLKNAYRRLAKKLHPDVSKDAGADSRFKEINEAYGVLSDPEKRAAYDQYGHEGLRGMGNMDFSGGFPFDDIFDQFFGGFGGLRRDGRRGARPGTDLRYDLTITFEEAVHGATREIEITRPETCSHCKGSRAEPGTSPSRCSQCNGSGEIRQVRQTFLGSMVNVNACPNCRGSGEDILSPCKQCQGDGHENARRKLSVKIPAGVDDETQIRLSGEGSPGDHGAPHGNLYVVLSVTPHAFFSRRQTDIVVELEINVSQAALGAEVIVPTIDGEEKLDIPSGTQPGEIFRLRGRGVPHIRGRGRGDQIIITAVVVPTEMTADQRRLLTELDKTFENGAKPRENKHEKGFFKQIRDVLGL